MAVCMLIPSPTEHKHVIEMPTDCKNVGSTSMIMGVQRRNMLLKNLGLWHTDIKTTHS